MRPEKGLDKGLQVLVQARRRCGCSTNNIHSGLQGGARSWGTIGAEPGGFLVKGGDVWAEPGKWVSAVHGGGLRCMGPGGI